MTNETLQNDARQRPDIILDLGRLRVNCHNNPAIIKELINHLLDKSGPKWLAGIRKAAATADSIAMEETCHSMKGSAATIFAWRISNLGLKYEKMARQGQIKEIIKDLPDLEEKFEELRKWARENIEWLNTAE